MSPSSSLSIHNLPSFLPISFSLYISFSLTYCVFLSPEYLQENMRSPATLVCFRVSSCVHDRYAIPACHVNRSELWTERGDDETRRTTIVSGLCCVCVYIFVCIWRSTNNQLSVDKSKFIIIATQKWLFYLYKNNEKTVNGWTGWACVGRPFPTSDSTYLTRIFIIGH